MTPILETRGLVKRFGGVAAIDGVDFRLEPGELRCLIGPNGAGKSTFFKMLTAQYAPTAGQILLDGDDITDEEPSEISRRGVGIKNQVPDVLDGLSVRENIWIAARGRHDTAGADHAVSEILERLNLGPLADRVVGKLSHGHRQWVEFGMVLAINPRLALLDEPTAGMTAEETRRTAELIREMNRSMAIVVVEHDMQFVRTIAHRVTVFDQGRILAEDTMDRIQVHPEVLRIYLGTSGHA
ncbi:urea ABC transporter ATP-binding protein UrtD [Paralimibaculum aggregatum]|uniref:Urea ABC transporter ATP-binding protein UrtD n=1 Tax=Paralimibaculum aggregatum TaxID=3036245 RepID=A0ABQ6LH11_9RHOB|nr:ABC transporter ATP-binding protein [Limibaculum sp. NKW23]GMG81515.1 urea ABC transporter ATP-binding protein UrtD [Limibaculum sp. NKW23]